MHLEAHLYTYIHMVGKVQYTLLQTLFVVYHDKLLWDGIRLIDCINHVIKVIIHQCAACVIGGVGQQQ